MKFHRYMCTSLLSLVLGLICLNLSGCLLAAAAGAGAGAGYIAGSAHHDHDTVVVHEHDTPPPDHSD